MELPPQYDPKTVEQTIYRRWLDSGAFHAVPDQRPPGKRFSVVIPPPNVTGALHLGHAINGTIQDILTRYHRMKGDNTLWMPGIDHAGIATQAVVEKTIFEKERKNRHDLGREELVRRIWEWKEQFGTRILNQLQSIGVSCDWQRARFTLDDVCAKAVREAFFKMFKDGLIFRGKRLVNWDTHLQTAVADDEIYHETVKGQMTSIKYPLDSPRLAGEPEANTEFLIVATTRPETMLGDTAVAVHPDDPRYQHLIGKHVILPLVGRKIPIIADGLLVDPKFGTGVVKVTPAHDPNDYATGQRHGLEMINLLTADGKCNEACAGEFRGIKYSYVGFKFATAARQRVLADLEGLGLVVEKKVHEHEVGHSDRSKTPIEPYLSDQWFVRMGDVEGQEIALADGTRVSGLAQAAMDAVTSGRVKIVPERYAKGYLDWLGQKRDWCISRQLWWGHRIPVWMHPRLDAEAFSAVSDFYDDPALAGFERYADWNVQRCFNESDSEVLGIQIETEPFFVCVAPGRPDLESRLEGAGFVQDPDVLDTWFSSALWPISTMGWPANGTSEKAEDQLLPYFYPTSVLSTAREILTLWVARMVMFGLYCKGDVPFRDVYIHAVIQDGEGRPMKKSLGNGVDPVDIVASHGADALRFTLAAMATETQDIRLPVVKDAKTGHNTSPKFDLGRNFANKVWNASRFILMNTGQEGNEEIRKKGNKEMRAEALEDRWILSRLHSIIRTASAHIEGYRFAELAEALRSFFWTDLCDWYLEIAKSRLKAGDAQVQSILLHCLTHSLKLLHPVMPFITEELWSKLPPSPGTAIPGPDGSLLITASWPAFEASQVDSAAESQIALIQSVTSKIREIQNRYPAAKGKDVIVRPRDEATRGLIEKSRGIIETLAGVHIVENSLTAAKPENAAAEVLSECQIFIAGVIDKAAETAKLTKRQADLEKFIASGKAKLANQAAVAKAPANVVQGWRDQLAKQQEELAAVLKNLAELA
jgi:valyl-tRNA synthetase